MAAWYSSMQPSVSQWLPGTVCYCTVAGLVELFSLSLAHFSAGWLTTRRASDTLTMVMIFPSSQLATKFSQPPSTGKVPFTLQFVGFLSKMNLHCKLTFFKFYKFWFKAEEVTRKRTRSHNEKPQNFSKNYRGIISRRMWWMWHRGDKKSINTCSPKFRRKQDGKRGCRINWMGRVPNEQLS